MLIRSLLFSSVSALCFGNIGNGTLAAPAREQSRDILVENLRFPTLAEHATNHPPAQAAEAAVLKADSRVVCDTFKRPGDNRVESATAPRIDKAAGRPPEPHSRRCRSIRAAGAPLGTET